MRGVVQEYDCLLIRRSAVDKDCRVRARISPRVLGGCVVSEFLKGNGHPWRESCYLLSIDFEQIRRWGGPPPGGIFWILTFGMHKFL